jgi:hypothetical protein
MPGRLASAEITDPAVIAAQVTPAIAEIVRRQVEVGIDCIGDGEFWTARSLAHYTAHFTGIEARPVAPGESPTTRHSTCGSRSSIRSEWLHLFPRLAQRRHGGSLRDDVPRREPRNSSGTVGARGQTGLNGFTSSIVWRYRQDLG